MHFAIIKGLRESRSGTNTPGMPAARTTVLLAAAKERKRVLHVRVKLLKYAARVETQRRARVEHALETMSKFAVPVRATCSLTAPSPGEPRVDIIYLSSDSDSDEDEVELLGSSTKPDSCGIAV